MGDPVLQSEEGAAAVGDGNGGVGEGGSDYEGMGDDVKCDGTDSVAIVTP